MSSLPAQTTPESVGADTTLIRPLPQAPGRVRIFFLDHLRAALTILVVLHHLTVIYGANAAFYYVEPPGPQDKLAFFLLLVFVLLNQAYFMGFFFLLSGYFTPGSFDRKGSVSFIKDRLLRLGIPLLVFIFVLSPLSFVGFFQMPPSLRGTAAPFSWQLYPMLLGVGPLWFAEMLLFFDGGYLLWRGLTRHWTRPWMWESKLPIYPTIGLFVLLLAGASYLLRIVVPMGKVGFVAALLATILLFPLALSGKTAFLGHGSWQSAVYALWDSIFSVGMCLGLLTVFRRFFNRQFRLSRFFSRQAFTVYIIHIPVIIFLALALRGLHPEQLLKFALAALVGVPLCFALAFLVRTIPFASRIL
jgi:glucans biosynthesis protein C